VIRRSLHRLPQIYLIYSTVFLQAVAGPVRFRLSVLPGVYLSYRALSMDNVAVWRHSTVAMRPIGAAALVEAFSRGPYRSALTPKD
jgi:hypothetical protein